MDQYRAGNLGAYSEAASLLIQTTPSSETHDEVMFWFLSSIIKLFPNDDQYIWCINRVATVGTRYRVDLVRRRRSDWYPTLLVELKTKRGEGGNPLMQLGRLLNVCDASKHC